MALDKKRVKFKRDEVLRDMRENVIEVLIKTPSGNFNIRYTLNPKFLPESYAQEEDAELAFHNKNPDLIRAWETQGGRWTTFNINDVEYVSGVVTE